jgi:molybdenum cofactor biosynthesis protein B
VSDSRSHGGERPARAAIITVSDGVTHGSRRDDSGDRAQEILEAASFEVAERTVVPDEQHEISAALRAACDHAVDLVVTTGGTGFGPRDVTPEATRGLLDREAPGLPELMRAEGIAKTPHAALSRGVAGARGRTLIVNLPGSPAGVSESLGALLPVLGHAVGLLRGHTEHAGDKGQPHEHSHPPGQAHEHGHSGGPGRPAGGHAHAAPESSAPGEGDLSPGTVVATVVETQGAPPCRVGQKLTLGSRGPLEGTLGCAEIDEAALGDVDELLRTGSPATRVYEHELGTVKVYLEPNPGPPRLMVWSATPVALELLKLGDALGYRLVLVESRSERITAGHRECAHETVAAVTETELDARTDAVLTDHDSPDVSGALAILLRSPARFIGIMGSTRHIGPHLEELSAEGFTEAEIGRIETPVGLDIGGRTPAEIALSIASGLVAARSGRSGGRLASKRGEQPDSVAS